MKREFRPIVTHILPLLAVVLVGACSEVGTEREVDKEAEAAATEPQSLIDKAEQGDAKAQYNLGVAYANGEGVPKDHKEALKWYHKAAEQGEALAQNNLGLAYLNGHGVPKDHKEAVKWWRNAAEQGEALAQYNLGVAYAYGYGVPKDDKAAVTWWRNAAEQGDAKAQFNLGVAYANGEGVPKDEVNAYAWHNVSSANGDEDASVERDRIAESMTPEQIAEAQELSREWFEKYQSKE